ncbi:MAG: Uncharacterised protein [Flavobacteriia bacterium]|nr:MAG: Uncharacterised protein [Flavobacteriia bacterium]
MEVSSAEHILAREYGRVVRHRIDLPFHHALYILKCLKSSSVHLWDATERIRVLYVLFGSVETRAVRQGAPDAFSYKSLSWLLAKELKALIKGLKPCIEGINGYAGDQIGPIGNAIRTKEGQRTDRRHELGSVEQRQTFLGPEAKVLISLGRPPVGCIHSPVVLCPKLSFPDQRQYQMSQWREIP